MGSKNEKILSYGKGTATLDDTLRDIFDVSDVSKWKKMTQQKKKSKKDEKKKSEEHASNIAKSTAVLTKSANYAGNFSYYIQAEGKARAEEVYGSISPNITSLYGQQFPVLIDFFSDYFNLGKVACNFNSKSKRSHNGESVTPGQSTPYSWDAHHMIPGEAFTLMKASATSASPIFNDQQYQLLLQSDYDVNNGNNLIALPTNGMDFFQPVHDLLLHPSNHSEYTKYVVNELKLLSLRLNELTKELAKPHPDVTVKIAKELKGLEDDLWDLLVRLGKAHVTSVVAKKKLVLSKEERQLVKLQTADGSTQYPLGALG